jgi:IclR family pca regulon transcriptional regulator
MSDFVQSLERGLAVIRAFDAENSELTLSEVARITGLTRAAARRFLHTLVDLGYMRTDGRLFALRPKILDLGFSYLSSLGLPDVARPHLEKLVAEVHESCSVSVLDNADIVYVARVPTKRIMTVVIEVGTRFPAHATSMGRVLLAAQDETWLDEFLTANPLTPRTDRTITDPAELKAELSKVRDQGWAMVDEELERGLRSVAAPIRGRAGKVRAAINVSTHISRGSQDAVLEELLPALLTTAAAISHDLSPT